MVQSHSCYRYTTGQDAEANSEGRRLGGAGKIVPSARHLSLEPPQVRVKGNGCKLTPRGLLAAPNALDILKVYRSSGRGLRERDMGLARQRGVGS
jgi:hypothetical protein